MVGDIRVDAFAFRPNPVRTGGMMIGNTASSLASIAGFNLASPQIVDSLCPTPAEFPTSTSEYELARSADQAERHTGRRVRPRHHVHVRVGDPHVRGALRLLALLGCGAGGREHGLVARLR